ncbi:MAG: MotA/TolQ/ExbB proton channel family protein [Proteobacteria bacterium]|jgi:biopolymer transport protein ExbB|nr:MotA/TolQ/ExbB proton channel family protein [Pseudomonadota bacterium]
MLTERIFAVAHVADQVVLWILVLLSIVSIGMILERWVSLRKISQNSLATRNRIKLALQSHSVADVEELSKDPSTVEGRALNFALKHIKESGSKGLEEVFNVFALTERPELEKYLSFLATVGSNAPYIGLLGTVLGIMKAFNDLAQSPEAGQQTVMEGISLALVATAAGLFVAIPAVIAYNYFQRQVRGVMQSLDSVKELCVAYAKKKGL